MKPAEDHPVGRCRVITDIVSLVGDKWSVLVIGYLGDGRKRFSEIKRSVDGISQKMLTLTLRGLERDGYVTRTVHPTIPPRVEYELTDLGRELLVPLKAIGEWALIHHNDVLSARKQYDTRIER
jgi:DNA-binding HxlR family transcriptional regulator